MLNARIVFSFLEQREALEEENRQVHNTNNATIERLQALETTTSQLQVGKIHEQHTFLVDKYD